MRNKEVFYISIHSLRVEGDVHSNTFLRPRIYFNPLPPRGGRPNDETPSIISSLFQSTPSAWRETTLREKKILALIISIHSLRVEGDKQRHCLLCSRFYFNPLPPRGGRLAAKVLTGRGNKFQSTPSAWRETLSRHCSAFATIYFNPLPPRGGRPRQAATHAQGLDFNPLPPRGGRRSLFIRSRTRE